MSNLAEKVSRLAHRARAHVYGETIIYKRGDEAVEIEEAIPRLPEYLVDESAGSPVRVSHEDLDWTLPADRLMLFGTLAKPVAGDRIVRVERGGETFEVLDRNRDKCWRWSNARKDKIRIHTKRVQ